MTTNEKIKKIVKLIIILISISLFVLLIKYAYAKYQTRVQGNTNVQIAEWHFDLRNIDGQSITVKDINFPMTRTDDNKSVSKDKLAPGTSGEFKMIVDTTNTQVMTMYTIIINLIDCPTNLKFYTDSNMQQELEKVKVGEKDEIGETIEVYQLKISKFLSLDVVDDTHTETLYWQWLLQTGDTPTQIYENDLEDSKWIFKQTMTMDISAVGEQVLKGPSLTSVVKIGDIVNYDASDTENGEIYTSEPFGIHSATFSSTDKVTEWRVLNIDNDTGSVELVGITNRSVYLAGLSNYMDLNVGLNNFCQVFGHGKGAIQARSITANDINQYTSFKKIGSAYNGYAYGRTEQWTVPNYIPDNGIIIESAEDEYGNVSTKTVYAGETVPIQSTYYTYQIKTKKLNDISDDLYDLLTRKNYILGSRYIEFQGGGYDFGMLVVKGGWIQRTLLYRTGNITSYAENMSIAPVIVLDPNVTIKGGNSETGWELDV